LNDTVKIFAIALASNSNPSFNFHLAFKQIEALGSIIQSSCYLIPCRDGIGEDYWNAACLVNSSLSVDEILNFLKQLESASGRIRPSHQITLDADLIAWGENLDNMCFNPKKLPLALDVKIPMYDLWKNPIFKHHSHNFPIISKSI
jgi:2-amino-4-hydroxy-6-hydroxymethyldihydropteridine diphosphokinase